MMSGPRVLGIALALSSAAAAAHDFWLQPQAWQVGASAPFSMSLLVGHGPFRQRSPIAASRIIRFEAIDGEGRHADLRNRLHLGAARGDATLAFRQTGTYLLVLETDDRAESHLPAIRYNDYLKVEGLTPALELRARTGRTEMDGSENYARHAKAIVEVGGASNPRQDPVTKPLGLKLEIVPERNPLAEPANATLPVRIFYRGQPLAGALVKLTDLAHDSEPVEMHRSGADGRAMFAMPKPGSWLINVIWTEPQGKDGLNDFETDFSSLTFNLPAARP